MLTYINLLWGQSLDHTVLLSENMTLIHQIILKILSKITRPWNRGHIDLHLYWGQTYWRKIPKNYVHTSNSLQDVTQNHWTMKYRSQWPIFILRSYWLVIPNNDVYISNSLQDIRQNHWTMKYRSQWPTLFWDQMLCHTDSSSQTMMFIHQIIKI